MLIDKVMSRKLRVGVISALLHPRYGGPASVVASHCAALDKRAELSVFGVAAPSDLGGVKALFPQAQVSPLTWPNSWYRGAGFHSALLHAARDLDILHAHMLWDAPVFSAWRIARLLGVPLIVTPHGSVSEEWRHSSLRKRIYRRLVSDQILSDAAAVHALTTKESEAINNLGLDAKTIVIPNGVSRSYFRIRRDRSAFESMHPKVKGRKIVMYLGRLWEDKGLDILPQAWANVLTNHPSAILVVAGPDYRGYRQIFEAKVKSYGITDSCLITGPLYNHDKIDALSAADVFVLASRSEAQSMSLIEASAAQLPCVFTPGCNATALARAGGGWEVDREATSVAGGLTEALSLEQDERYAYGERARDWAAEHFSLELVGSQLFELYEMAFCSHGRQNRDSTTLTEF